MTDKKHVVLAVFFCLSAIHLIFILADWPSATRASKIILMPTLLIWIWFSVRRGSRGGGFSFISIALLFSWLGDLLLLFNSFIYFLSGLVAFLFAHLSYLRVLFWPKPTLKFYPINALFAGLIVLALIYPLKQIITNLPEILTVPVILYATVLLGLFVLTNFRLKAKAFYQDYVISGALFFAVSDTILAFNKFVNPIAWASFLIMLTYLSAQYLLASGLIKDLEKN